MKRLAPLAFLAFPLVALPAAAAPLAPSPGTSLSVQDDDEKPDRRPEIKELCNKLKDHARARGKEDREAVATVDELVQEFPKSGPKDRASIVKEISNCFKQKRRPNKEGVRDNQLFLASSVALGEMGPESVKVISTWIGHKDHDDDLEVQSRLILSLGKTKDEDAVKPLLDLLSNHQPIVQAKTAEALANFTHLELKDRKEIFKEVLDQFTAIKSRVDTDPNDTTARDRYDAVRAPMRSTLQAMSGQDFSQPSEWRSWWNNNKKKNWDEAG